MIKRKKKNKDQHQKSQDTGTDKVTIKSYENQNNQSNSSSNEWIIPKDIDLYLNLSKLNEYIINQGVIYDEAKEKMFKAEKSEQKKLFTKRKNLNNQILKLKDKLNSLSKDKLRILHRYERELNEIKNKIEERGIINSTLLSSNIGLDCLLSSSNGSLYLNMGLKNQIGFSIVGEKDCIFSHSVPNEEWIHIGLASKKNSISLYMNGKKMEEIKRNINLSFESIGSSSNTFYGYIQEIRYWKINSISEVEEGKQTLPLQIPNDELLGYWTMEEGYGEFINDVSLNHTRARCINTKWVDYDTTPILGGIPPTKSYRERFVCNIVIKRRDFAKLIKERSRKILCTQGCDFQITQGNLNHHLVVECINRMVICSRIGCHKSYKFSEKNTHLNKFCEPLLYREELVKNYLIKEKLTMCPYNCGIYMKKRFIDHHIQFYCINRLITCPNKDCGKTIRPRNQKLHNLKECKSPHLLYHRILVEKSRKRQYLKLKSNINKKD